MLQLKNLINSASRIFLIASLSCILILVFLNVILRYLFDSGIFFSVELSGFIFVWMVFVGSVVALVEGKHVSVNIVLDKLTPKKRKVLQSINCILIIVVGGMILQGSWNQILINIHTYSPSAGISMAYFYLAGLFFSICSIVIASNNLFKIIRS